MNLETLIHITSKTTTLEGMLKIPSNAKGLVLFSHGSGSSRHSPRNNYVATILNNSGLASLLIDLLSPEEDEIYKTRFNIDLLASRLTDVVQWLMASSLTKKLPLGLFGSSTGAAAAIAVAASLKKTIKAVVSRGGRPDLALKALGNITAPTLFIVGGNDTEVLHLNEKAFEFLICEKKMEIIPYATHLFEEPGCLEEVAKVSSAWFNKHLSKKT